MNYADKKKVYGPRVFARLVATAVNANVELGSELADPGYEAEKQSALPRT